LNLVDFDAGAAWRRMAPRPRTFTRPTGMAGRPRQAAVLLLLYPLNGSLAFVLTRRSENVEHHRGQISLPGGACDPEDANPAATALREACEEVRICAEEVRLLGHLNPFYVVVSDFEISPYVGSLSYRPEFTPNPEEVAEVIEVPLNALLDDGLKAEERWQLRGFELDVPFYRYGSHVVWGATAAMLSEFEMRLKFVLGAA